MDPIFQNKYVITRDNVKEFYQVSSPLWKSIILYPGIILYAGFLMYLAYHELHDILFLSLLAAFYLGLIWRSTIITRKLVYERMPLNKMDDLNRTIAFTDNIEVIAPSTGSIGKYDYSHVYKFYESKNLYVLMLPHGLGIYLEKGKFTIGNESEFIDFIKDRCIHLSKGKKLR